MCNTTWKKDHNQIKFWCKHIVFILSNTNQTKKISNESVWFGSCEGLNCALETDLHWTRQLVRFLCPLIHNNFPSPPFPQMWRCSPTQIVIINFPFTLNVVTGWDCSRAVKPAEPATGKPATGSEAARRFKLGLPVAGSAFYNFWVGIL